MENRSVDLEFERTIDCPVDRFVHFENHRPTDYDNPYHFHASIEINYLYDCDMTYSFSGSEVVLKQGRVCVFWAAYPHRKVSVSGDGYITNAYVALSEFLRWQIPSDFVSKLLNGAVLCSKRELASDRLMAKRWAAELDRTDLSWQRLHGMEIQCRLNRLAIEGWEVLLPPNRPAAEKMIGGKAVVQFEKMLRYIAQNFSDRIKVSDVAQAGCVSSNYAMSLFRKILGITIKDHITEIRLFRAKMLLEETTDKIRSIAIDCGYSSLSAFYESFQQKVGVSPAVYRKSVSQDS